MMWDLWAVVRIVVFPHMLGYVAGWIHFSGVAVPGIEFQVIQQILRLVQIPLQHNQLLQLETQST